ncbi:MAG: hypothetical protein ACLTWW_12250, partial [Negativibacillus sp.]
RAWCSGGRGDLGVGFEDVKRYAHFEYIVFLQQKERGPDGASPLDRIMRCSKISAAFIAVFKNSAEQNGIFTICSLRILLRWENRIRQKDKVSAGKIRTRQ